MKKSLLLIMSTFALMFGLVGCSSSDKTVEENTNQITNNDLSNTENIDNSVLASTLGVFMFLEAENEYTALEEVKNITQKYNTTELNSISSVYDRKGEKIIEIEDEVNI